MSSLLDLASRYLSIKSIVLLIGIYLATSTLQAYVRRRSLPPGPRRWPIVGNALQIPSQMPVFRLTEWSKMYGPIFSFDLFGQQFVVLNTNESATGLLDHRSNIYSDRPKLIMGNVLTSGFFMIFLKYGALWRKHRRFAHESFNLKAVEKFRPMEMQAAARVMLYIFGDVDKRSWLHYIEQFSATCILGSVYGWSLSSPRIAPVAISLRRIAEKISTAGAPGSYLVEIFPAMMYLPSWFAGWKRKGLEWSRNNIKELIEYSSDIGNGVGDEDCFVTQLINNIPQEQINKSEQAWMAGTMLIAGFETSATALQFFVLAMTLYPDVMVKAQAELDTVVGRSRAPTFDDIDDLPYIQAIVRETHRWRPVGPLGVPHRTTEDDWYEGYFIPKGTTVIANIWAMNRDPTVYPDFDVFRPERYLEDAGPVSQILSSTHDMGHVSFGFGRRICVGMHFANQELYIMIATLLWAANIQPALDESGKPIIPSAHEWVDRGIVVAPKPFSCAITPRFAEAEAILGTTLSEM